MAPCGSVLDQGCSGALEWVDEPVARPMAPSDRRLLGSTLYSRMRRRRKPAAGKVPASTGARQLAARLRCGPRNERSIEVALPGLEMVVGARAALECTRAGKWGERPAIAERVMGERLLGLAETVLESRVLGVAPGPAARQVAAPRAVRSGAAKQVVASRAARSREADSGATAK
jgi:hypothetical protein